MKAKSMSIPDFVRNGWKEERTIDLFIAHLERNKIKYRIVGMTIIVFLGMSSAAFAGTTGIDKGANELYTKLLRVAKWIIVFKGGIDTIKDVFSDGDLQSAKKHFLGYTLVYALLWGLPWAFNQVDIWFTEMNLEASSSS